MVENSPVHDTITVDIPAAFYPYQGTSGYPPKDAVLRVLQRNVPSPHVEGCQFLICTDGQLSANTLKQIENPDKPNETREWYDRLSQDGVTWHLNRWFFITHPGPATMAERIKAWKSRRSANTKSHWY